jgi:CBS domain-containing protein
MMSSSTCLAILGGLIAVATAPAATLLVVREYESDGPVTDLVLALIGLNNLFSITAFNIAVHFMFGQGNNFLIMLARVLGPVAFGFILGFIISVWKQRLSQALEMQLLLLGGIIVTVGIARSLNLDIFLTSFTCGLVIVNASPGANDLFSSLRGVDYPLYVIFFVLAGASLQVDSLTRIGSLGITYIVMRSLGKITGGWLGARVARMGAIERRWLGFALLSQAGVAIGLASKLALAWPGGGQVIQTIVLGAVVFFELTGPLAVRGALVHTGEVPLINLLVRRRPEGTYEGFHHVLDTFRASIGLPDGHKMESAADILIQHVMRKNVETIHENTPFNDILHRISHSKYDRFPIVDKENHFIGVIDYRDIRDVIFDEALSRLVVARDLVRPEPLTLRPDQTLGQVMEIFQANSDISYLPVISQDDARNLLGIISQNDILAAFRRMKKQGGD